MPDDHASSRSDRSAAHPDEISHAGWWEILKRVWQASSEKSLWVAATGVAFFAFLIVSLALCYRIGPCRAAPKWRWVAWGAAAGAALWILASLGFSLYVRHVANYATAYGVAGSVLTVMIWLYLVAYAVLIGAALNAEMERQTSRDTTVGADRPVGARGAKAADHKPQ